MTDDTELQEATSDLWDGFSDDVEEDDPGAGLPADVAAKFKQQEEHIKKLESRQHERDVADSAQIRADFLARCGEKEKEAANVLLPSDVSPKEMRAAIRQFQTGVGILSSQSENPTEEKADESKSGEDEDDNPGAFSPPMVGEPAHMVTKAEQADEELWERIKKGDNDAILKGIAAHSPWLSEVLYKK